MKTFPESFSKIYSDWSAVGVAMALGHAPASPDTKPNGKPAPHSAVQGWEGEGGMLKAPKKAAPRPALRKAQAKKRPAKKAKAKRR